MAKLADFPHSDESPAEETRLGESASKCFCPHGGLVAKSSIEFQEQVRNLLRSRLRNAAIVLFVILIAHLIRAVFTQDKYFSLTLAQLWPQMLVTAAEGVCIALLCVRCQQSIFRLRVIEIVMFALPAMWLVHVQGDLAGAAGITGPAARGTQLVAFSVPWILLLTVYGLFIPNTWQRATAVVSVFSVGPLATVLWASKDSVVELRALYDSGAISFNLMEMAAAAAIAVWCAHRFGTLRRETFDLKHVGVYSLLRRLGSGGMGDVFLAEHRLLKRPCAVKLIRRDRENDDSTISRFQNEVQATAQLTHPNTVEIYDYGVTDNGMFFYVMEHLPGMSVQELVDRAGPLPAGRVIHLLRQVCAALAEAHRAGLIHRDIKPANIFAAERGGIHDFAKLLDFGLVKSTGSAEGNIQNTRDGVVVGSPLYSAPETALGEGVVDGRVDIYSLGATAYFLLTGRPVFRGKRALDIVFAHAREAPEAPSQFAEVPDDLEAVVMRCLLKSPDERYADVDELEQALAACEDVGSWDSSAADQWWREFEASNPTRQPMPVDEYAETTVATPAMAAG